MDECGNTAGSQQVDRTRSRILVVARIGDLRVIGAESRVILMRFRVVGYAGESRSVRINDVNFIRAGGLILSIEDELVPTLAELRVEVADGCRGGSESLLIGAVDLHRVDAWQEVGDRRVRFCVCDARALLVHEEDAAFVCVVKRDRTSRNWVQWCAEDFV